MAKRKTITGIKISSVESVLCSRGWSKAFFCAELMGKGRGWITEWKRERNLPSPEEAARMCAILQVEPEEILTEPSDIELVRSLIEQERGEEKKPPAQGGEPDKDELVRMVERVTNEATLRAVLNAVNKKFQELG